MELIQLITNRDFVRAVLILLELTTIYFSLEFIYFFYQGYKKNIKNAFVGLITFIIIFVAVLYRFIVSITMSHFHSIYSSTFLVGSMLVGILLFRKYVRS